MKTIIGIKKDIREQLKTIDADEMDDASWGYEKGVLITGNEAKLVLESLKK